MGFSFLTSKSGLCFFANMSPLALAISAISINVFMFCFIIWEASDAVWGSLAAKYLFWIGFVLEILSFLGILGILILVLIRNNSNYSNINNIGKITCMIVSSSLIIALIFFLISMFINIARYAQLEYGLLGYAYIPGKWWATIIVPPIIYLIGVIFLQICVKALYICFKDNIYDSISKHSENETAVPATSVTEIPRNQIPGSNTLITQVDPITVVEVDNKGAKPGNFTHSPGTKLDNIVICTGNNKNTNPENNLVKPVNGYNNNFSPATQVNIASSKFQKKN